MGLQSRTFEVGRDARVRVTVEVIDCHGNIAIDRDGQRVLPNVFVGRGSIVFMDASTRPDADGDPRIIMAGAGAIPFQLDLLFGLLGMAPDMINECIDGIHSTHCPFVHASAERVHDALTSKLNKEHQGSRNDYQG